MNPSTHLQRIPLRVALALGACLAVFCALPLSAGTAHALFATGIHSETLHNVKAFPTSISVETSGVKRYFPQIDPSQLTVTATYNDGTSRVLDADEYELSPAEVPPGFKGDFECEVVYCGGGHEVSSAFTFEVDSAYAAQYGDTLVFGRGMPEETYQEKALANTTWGIEEAGCTPAWNKAALTSVVDIDTVAPVSLSGWFNETSTIRTIALDQMDTSQVRTLANAFLNDSALETLDITGWDTSGVGSMAACFRGCGQLTGITGLADLDTSQVTDMSYLFFEDAALASADVARWDTGKVATFNRTFDCCYSLRTLNLSAWNTSSCSDMTCMFYMYPIERSSLTSVGDLSNWNVSRVTSMGSMFAYNDELTSVGNIGRWNTAALTLPSHMFQYCQSLSYVGDLGGWNVSKCSDFANMFQWCRSLASIGDVSQWNVRQATTMFQMFQGCSSLTVDCTSWWVPNVTNSTNFNSSTSGTVRAPTFKV